jgi:hypothetical protein
MFARRELRVWEGLDVEVSPGFLRLLSFRDTLRPMLRMSD